MQLSSVDEVEMSFYEPINKSILKEVVAQG
jgi:hypothetical protein